jgi:hypothetical protein
LTVCTTRRGHAELEARSNRLAHFLRSVGLKRLDHYSIFTENNARYVECCDTWPTKPKRCAVSICTEAAWDAEQRAVEAGIRTDADADADAATLDELALAGVRAVRYVTRRRITRVHLLGRSPRAIATIQTVAIPAAALAPDIPPGLTAPIDALAAEIAAASATVPAEQRDRFGDDPDARRLREALARIDQARQKRGLSQPRRYAAR